MYQQDEMFYMQAAIVLDISDISFDVIMSILKNCQYNVNIVNIIGVNFEELRNYLMFGQRVWGLTVLQLLSSHYDLDESSFAVSSQSHVILLSCDLLVNGSSYFLHMLVEECVLE